MAKSKTFTCPYCNNKVLKEESVQQGTGRGTRYYHPECYDKKLKEEEIQRQHAEDYKELIAYICELYKLEAPTGMILKQIKDYTEEYGYKLKGIQLALRYFYETLGNPIREGDGIGIVPYVYEKAKQHFIRKLNVEKSIENLTFDYKPKIIYIKSPEVTIVKRGEIIDISSL